MIRKLVRQMLAAQALSAMTVSLCLLIDSILIGRFLTADALSAYGLASPLLLFIGAIGTMLCAGAQVACSRSLGRGSQEETNIGYCSTLAVAAVSSIAFLLCTVVFRTPLARLLGANEPGLLKDTSAYLAGFSIGAPASIGAMVLVPFLQIAGQNSLLVAAVLGMTVADVVFDLLNVLVFHGGMFGMGLASALSYYVAVVIGGRYFFSKKNIYVFSMSRIRWKKIKELVVGGIPSLVGMASSVLMILCTNRILLHAGGAAAVAAYSVISSIMNTSNCISAGSGGVALTLSGVLYNEEDRTGLKELVQELLRAAIVLGLSIMALLMVFARPCVTLFLPKADEAQAMAISGLRIYLTGLSFCCMSNALRSCYQGTGRVRMMEVISILANFVLPVLSAFLLTAAFGLGGTWFLFITSEVLILAGIITYAALKKGRFPWRADDILLLDETFGVGPQDRMEANPASMEEVIAFSRGASQFCRAQGGSEHMASSLALCIEEMGGNIIRYGFTKKGKNRLTIRLSHKEAYWTLRFRDNCMAFDPIRHVTEGGGEDGVGIRLAMRMASEARYTYSMNMNNLTLVLKDEA